MARNAAKRTRVSHSGLASSKKGLSRLTEADSRQSTAQNGPAIKCDDEVLRPEEKGPGQRRRVPRVRQRGLQGRGPAARHAAQTEIAQQLSRAAGGRSRKSRSQPRKRTRTTRHPTTTMTRTALPTLSPTTTITMPPRIPGDGAATSLRRRPRALRGGGGAG